MWKGQYTTREGAITSKKGAVFPPLPKDRGFHTEEFDEHRKNGRKNRKTATKGKNEGHETCRIGFSTNGTF